LLSDLQRRQELLPLLKVAASLSPAASLDVTEVPLDVPCTPILPARGPLCVGRGTWEMTFGEVAAQHPRLHLWGLWEIVSVGKERENTKGQTSGSHTCGLRCSFLISVRSYWQSWGQKPSRVDEVQS
jgi:hypothetical protein